MSDQSTTAPTDQTSVAAAPALIANFTAADAAFREIQPAILRRIKPILFGACEAAGIARVTVTFDGYGDSGQIESVDAYGADDQKIDLPTEAVTYPCAFMEGRYEPSTETPSGNRFLGYEVGEIEKTSTLRQIVEDIFWDFIGAKHDGWEDGEGGYGECVFEVESQTIRLEMNERYTETNYHEHEM